jgi:hypothetical protein
VEDPLLDAATLARAVTSGILDAPHLKNNPFGRGAIRTQIVKGQCLTIDEKGHPLNEAERLSRIRKEAP